MMEEMSGIRTPPTSLRAGKASPSSEETVKLLHRLDWEKQSNEKTLSFSLLKFPLDYSRRVLFIKESKKDKQTERRHDHANPKKHEASRKPEVSNNKTCKKEEHKDELTISSNSKLAKNNQHKVLEDNMSINTAKGYQGNILTINSINSFSFSSDKRHIESALSKIDDKIEVIEEPKKESPIPKTAKTALIKREISPEKESGMENDEDDIKCTEQLDELPAVEIKPEVSDISKAPQEPAAIEEQSQNALAIKKKISCNCKKTRCLKLYCDCFSAGEYCKDCNCTQCANIAENEEERQQSMLLLMERNPAAFKPKLDAKTDIMEESNEPKVELRHIKGCNCKKSGCKKKYCECFQAGIKCSELCKCDGCKNCDNPCVSKENSNSFFNCSTRANSNDRGFIHEFEFREDFLSSNGEYKRLRNKKQRLLDCFNSFNTNIIQELDCAKYFLKESPSGHLLRPRQNKKPASNKEKLFLKPNCKENVKIYTAGTTLKIEIEK